MALVFNEGSMNAPEAKEVFLMNSLRDLDFALLVFILFAINVSIDLLSSSIHMHSFWGWNRVSLS